MRISFCISGFVVAAFVTLPVIADEHASDCCRDRAHTMEVRPCVRCGKEGADCRLCKGCAAATSECSHCRFALGFTPLFNGKDLTGWDTYLGPPKRGETPPIGLNTDPRGVFTVVEVDGKPAIRISGEVYGVLVTREEHENYHFRVEFKWGEKRWPPRETKTRDSGILYHSVGPHGAQGGYWMKSFECNIEEKSCGDFWSVAGTIVDVEGRVFGDPKKEPVVFKKGAPRQTVRIGRIVKRPDSEKPTGEWNVVDVLCVGGTSVHAINGKTNLILTNLRQEVEGKEVPLTRGKIQLQSEGAEVFYRKPEVRPITEIPLPYRE